MGEMRVKPIGTPRLSEVAPQGRPTGVAKSGPAFQRVPDTRLIAKGGGGLSGTYAARLAGGNATDRVGLELCAKAGALTIDVLTKERPGIVAAIEKLAIG